LAVYIAYTERTTFSKSFLSGDLYLGAPSFVVAEDIGKRAEGFKSC